MELRDAIWTQNWAYVDILLNDPTYDVNKLERRPPLAICAEKAQDIKTDSGDYMGDQYVWIMKRILDHPTFKRDPTKDICSEALFTVCFNIRSVTAANCL